eukprot:CAMPEP_0113573170 /NCGR_PEP_ID=MMETSP0015_2-20120614/26473_1 /TAXON_ID=2838 /ORGANISM="Odontella" /LENGTH=72 /DNA_ID=CAMNT_0000476227 /DNA_START=228 /DNA_END=446 /DNA_ORIENTATION=+ /assembly_acc=CAM_ASM_000160
MSGSPTFPAAAPSKSSGPPGCSFIEGDQAAQVPARKRSVNVDDDSRPTIHRHRVDDGMCGMGARQQKIWYPI